MDVIVHHVLYDWGLEFSYAWADPYWIGMGACRISIALMAGACYYFFRSGEEHHKVVPIGIISTILGLFFGGLEDTMYFLIIGGFPPMDSVWWWSPFNRFLGIRWTTKEHLIYNAIWIIGLIVMWLIIKFRYNILRRIKNE